MAEWVGQHPYLYILIVLLIMAVVQLLLDVCIKYVSFKLKKF